MKHYLDNIEQKTLENENYREVLYTGSKIQLVVMAVPVGESVGEEVHMDHDQFLRVESGRGKAILDGVPYDLSEDDALIVPAGMRHDIVNVSGDKPLRLYTIYAPPEHAPDTLHPRKEDE
jgi:mannose-6-phosphate isomerase-like protein (cupin superfamily)